MSKYLRSQVASALRRPGDNILGWFILKYMERKNYYLEKGAVKLSCIEPNHNVLEVGFGHGLGLETAFNIIKGGNGKICGVDYSPLAVKRANRNFKEAISSGQIEIHQANVMSLPFLDNEFDRVFHCNCYYFWPDVSTGVRELYRVLKPGGIMVTTMNLEHVQHAKSQGCLSTANTDPLNYMVALENAGFHNVAFEYLRYRNNSYQAVYAEVIKT